MASSSTSSIQKTFKYDVFLSFRGADTRKNFVDHLYYALEQKSIHTYKDEERIETGKRIRDELIKSIENSRFHIIVFSKNYASSSWCLDELVKIVECHKTTQHTAYPIFYDVEPSEVHKQCGEFGKVFTKHEKEDVIEKWREALEEAAVLAGWELKNTVDGNEAKFIQKIVEEISLQLRSIKVSIDEKLIGMESRTRDVVSSLEMGIDDVRMIGIKGMGGGGKTTLARAVFDQIYFQFEGSSFVENVRENSNPNLSGLKMLQKQVLRDVLNDQNINISNVHNGKKMMKKMMCCRKVLVVLDDVNHIDQLKALVGETNWYGKGSRIIITTRDEQALVAHGVNLIRDVNLLSHEEAICLFSRYAFRRESPIQGYTNLSRQVVGYSAGLPLTITVLGSFLCGKNELEWKDSIERLRTIPLRETLQKLELSYMGLEDDYKEIFLDVACLMKYWEKEDAIKVLESYGFHARIGLRVLEQKSLLTISKYKCFEFLDMHDHIEEMGKNIVRRLHPNEPNRHSRLWIRKEINDILVNNKGTEATTRIEVWPSKVLNPEIVMKGLGNMKNLRYLNVYLDCHDSSWKFDDVNLYFPNTLQYLSWSEYPFGSLPKTFQANNLVALEMCPSRIVQLWEGGERKILKKLKLLDLSCSNLKSLDLGMTPNLENLFLADCFDLVEILIPVECLTLKFLNLGGCKLKALDLRRTPNLERLRLDECTELVEFHISVECHLKLTSLNISSYNLRTVDLRGTPYLETIRLDRCLDLIEFYISVECRLKLRSLYLIDCCKLRTLDLQKTPNLDTLALYNCDDLIEFHTSIECRLNITSINIEDCKLRTLDLRGTLYLETLSLEICDLVELHIPIECLKLTSLYLSSSKLRSLDLRGAPNLELLQLKGCDQMVELNIPIKCLKLTSLNLGSSKLRSLDLRGAPNLKEVFLGKCVDFAELHTPVECLRLKTFNLGSSKLRILDLLGAPNLETLSVRGCYNLVELHMGDLCLKLKSINIMGSKLKTLDLQGAPNLETLSVKGCYNLVELHMGDLCPKLKTINIKGSKLRNVDLQGAPNIETLSVRVCYNLAKLHMGDLCLKLKSIDINGSKLMSLDLRGAPNLEALSVRGCYNLEELHMEDLCLKLKSINIIGSKLRTFDLERTPNLKTLSLT